MTHLHVEGEIHRILSDQLRMDVPEPGTDLLESGLLDSLGFVDLVASIETTFRIEISLVDVDLDAFRTVESIAGFVREQTEPAGPPEGRARPEASTAPSAPPMGAPGTVVAEAG